MSNELVKLSSGARITGLHVAMHGLEAEVKPGGVSIYSVGPRGGRERVAVYSPRNLDQVIDLLTSARSTLGVLRDQLAAS